MLRRFFKKDKPKLWLGVIAVAPRSDWARHLDEWDIFGRKEDLDESIQNELKNIFELPSASSLTHPNSNDYSLDVVVPKFQSGDAWGVSLGDVGFPLIWRPKIEIGARLVNLESGKTVYSTTVKVKLNWRNYLSRLFSVRAIIRYKPLFDAEDMKYLLYEACIKLLHKLRSAV